MQPEQHNYGELASLDIQELLHCGGIVHGGQKASITLQRVTAYVSNLQAFVLLEKARQRQPFILSFL